MSGIVSCFGRCFLAIFNFLVSFHTLLTAIAVRFIFFWAGTYLAYVTIEGSKEGEIYLYLIFFPHAGMLLELLHNAFKKCGKEYSWKLRHINARLCIPVCLFLAATVPSLWIIHEKTILNEDGDPFFTDSNITDERLIGIVGSRIFDKTGEVGIYKKITNHAVDLPESIIASYRAKFKSRENQLMQLVQLVLMVLLFGRWVLPRGKMTREQLSLILVGYISMCADMLDLISLITFMDVYHDVKLRYAIQIVWALSLIQLCLVKSTIDNNVRLNESPVNGSSPERQIRVELTDSFYDKCKNTGLVYLLITMMLQDIPYFVLRILVLRKFPDLGKDSIYFFFGKNTLSVLFDGYRSAALFKEIVYPTAPKHDEKSIGKKKKKDKNPRIVVISHDEEQDDDGGFSLAKPKLNDGRVTIDLSRC